MKLFGSSLILAGTALGAGMLAIPMVLAQFGFLWSLALMVFIFLGTTYASLLLAEVCTKTEDNGGLSTVAFATLGTKGKYAMNLFFYLLLLCIIVAYILGLGDLFHKLLLAVGFDAPQPVCYSVFSLLMGVIVVLGKSYIDKLNRVLFILMIVMLCVVIISLFSDLHFDYLLQSADVSMRDVVKYSTVIFTSFASMVVIPSLVSYNHEASAKQIRNMILLGSVIPLICYLTWLVAIIGNLGTDQISQFNNISELITAFSGHSSILKTVISVFSALALITSFLGVSMALFDQNKDAILNNNALSFGLTFVLPLFFAALFSDQFISMLDYAGMVLVFLAIWGPLAMVISARRSTFQLVKGVDSYTAEGGILMLAVTFLFGAFIFVSWFTQ
ncbi:amino acid permease [Vibrio sp. S17_S38]|uniref:amino acid permease n=1 Tax=Vibrio sp. S17_S38 TaxID=2720229 RepID=UPI0016818453|nr:aromatic amino acid transport family protein [Vibrio sp. S17_S38]MBD1572956.1 amino acid permease [Vibrio sp. S17_S38]